MRIGRPLFLYGVWGHPAPLEVLPEPQRGWHFAGEYPVRYAGEKPAASARSLLQELLKEIAPFSSRLRVGAVFIGSARGELACLLSIYEGWRAGQVSFLRGFPETGGGALATLVAEALGCEGPAIMLSQTCISGLAALHQAVLHTLATGEVACFGAVEGPLPSLLVESFGYLRLASRRKAFPYTHPFGENSVVLSEGVVLGFTGPERSPWQVEAVALRQSGGGTFTALAEEAFPPLLRVLADTPPQAVILHAPGTRRGDFTELRAIEAVWGRLPALTLKPLTGHSIGASGLLSLLWAKWLIENQVWLYNEGELRVAPPEWPTFPTPQASGLVRPIHSDRPPERIAILGAGFGGGVAGVILRYAPGGADSSPP